MTTSTPGWSAATSMVDAHREEPTGPGRASMPGRVSQPWCPSCNAPPGPDCPVRTTSPRQVRRRLKTELREASRG